MKSKRFLLLAAVFAALALIFSACSSDDDIQPNDGDNDSSSSSISSSSSDNSNGDPSSSSEELDDKFSSSSGEELSSSSGDVEISSSSSIATYTVTYNGNVDGVLGIPASQTKTHDIELTLSDAIPTRDGYTFSGWNTEANGSGTSYEAEANYTNNADVTLYARWTANTYTVTYNANATGVTGMPENQTKTHDIELTLSNTTPLKTGHSFINWNTKADGSGTSYEAGDSYTANADVTLYAQWIENTYMITYNGNATGVTGVPDPHDISLPLRNATPSRTGYTFSGWNTEADGSGTNYEAGASLPNNNADVTLYAQWIPTYTVTYNANGGTGAPAAQTKTHDVNLTLSSTEPTRTGYTFKGWNTEADGSGTAYAKEANYSNNADVTLYAQWIANTYTVTYSGNATDATIAGIPENQTKTHDIVLTLSDVIPTREGYTFSGWNTATSGNSGTAYATGASYANNASVTLYARWTANTYPVTYNANAGDDNVGSMPAAQSKTHGSNLTLRSDTPTRTGYTFVNWNTEPDGSGTSYARSANYTVNAPLTLYAQWTVATYTVTYNSNANEAVARMPANQTKTYGIDLMLSDAIPRRAGYEFTGWNTAANGTGTAYAAGASYTGNAAVTLYARWEWIAQDTWRKFQTTTEIFEVFMGDKYNDEMSAIRNVNVRSEAEAIVVSVDSRKYLIYTEKTIFQPSGIGQQLVWLGAWGPMQRRYPIEMWTELLERTEEGIRQYISGGLVLNPVPEPEHGDRDGDLVWIVEDGMAGAGAAKGWAFETNKNYHIGNGAIIKMLPPASNTYTTTITIPLNSSNYSEIDGNTLNVDLSDHAIVSGILKTSKFFKSDTFVMTKE